MEIALSDLKTQVPYMPSSHVRLEGGMALDVLVVTALGAAAAKVAAEVYGALKEYLEQQADKRKEKLLLRVADKSIEFDVSLATPELVDSLRRALESQEKISGDPFALSRKAIAKEAPREDKHTLESERQTEMMGALALAIDPKSVFRDARRRIDLVFRLNLGLAIALAIILLGGIVGAIVCAIFLNKGIWALAFGGVSVADLIGVYAFKPLTAINSALVGTQRLDSVYLRLQEQLKACAEHTDLQERIRCQTIVWEAMQRELATLAGA